MRTNTTSMRWTCTAIALVAALLLTAVPVANAHNGNGGSAGVAILPAETYDSPDDPCDPDFDGEHTKVKGDDAFLPHSGCGLNWKNVEFDGLCQAQSARVTQTGQLGGDAVYEIRVFQDGDLAGKGRANLKAGQETSVDLTPTFTTISANDDVRVEYSVVSGHSFGNLRIDYVSWGLGCVVADL